MLVSFLSVEVVHQLGVGVLGLQYGGHPPGGAVGAGGPVRQVAGAPGPPQVLRGGYELYVGQPSERVDLVQVLDGLHGQTRVEDGVDIVGVMGVPHTGEHSQGFDRSWLCQIVKRLRESRDFRSKLCGVSLVPGGPFQSQGC